MMRFVACLSLTAAFAGAVAGAAAPDSRGAATCTATVAARVLPAWARAGFSDPRPRMPYVLGSAGKILAILWADPLESPAPKDHNNKILWVSHAAGIPGSNLRISAQRLDGTTAVGAVVSRSVMGGPGPSIINLPAAGCWRVTLRWSGQVDTLDLRYVSSQ